MIEDTHCESGLRELTVGHEAVWLEAFILCRSHTWEVDAVLGAPVVLLEIAQMVCHHSDVSAPIFFETYEHSHSDGVDAGLSHAVEAVATPFKLALHAAWVIELVVFTVVSLLEAYYSVESVVCEFGVFFSCERHYLNLDVREVFLCYVDSFSEIWDTSFGRVLTCDE